jgi:hypothetical protein
MILYTLRVELADHPAPFQETIRRKRSSGRQDDGTDIRLRFGC